MRAVAEEKLWAKPIMDSDETEARKEESIDQRITGSLISRGGRLTEVAPSGRRVGRCQNCISSDRRLERSITVRAVRETRLAIGGSSAPPY